MEAKLLEDGAKSLNGFSDADAGTEWGEEEGGSIFTEVTSLINVRDTSYTDNGLRVGDLMEDWPTPSALPALDSRLPYFPEIDESYVPMMSSVVVDGGLN